MHLELAWKRRSAFKLVYLYVRKGFMLLKSICKLEATEIKFLDNLEKNNIGFYEDNIVSIENSFFGNNKYFEKLIGEKRRIEIAQIELTNKCNFNCEFCDGNSKVVYRRTGCKRWNDDCDELSIKEWEDIIEQLYLLGCSKIEFLGGEPLLQWEKFSKLVTIAYEKGIKDIVLYTNGVLINDVSADFIKKYNVKCIIQVVKLNYNKEILGIVDDYNYTELFDKLARLNLKFEILLLIMKDNEIYVEDYIKIFKKMSIMYRIDFIYPYPNNIYFSSKYEKLIVDYKRHIIRCTPVTLGILLVKNPCYHNRIAFSSTGKVYPCILSRKETYGDYRKERNIFSFIEKDFEKYKNLNKDKYDSCGSCVYRYSCFTCSAIDVSCSNDGLKCSNCSLVEVL